MHSGANEILLSFVGYTRKSNFAKSQATKTRWRFLLNALPNASRVVLINSHCGVILTALA